MNEKEIWFIEIKAGAEWETFIGPLAETEAFDELDRIQKSNRIGKYRLIKIVYYVIKKLTVYPSTVGVAV